MILLRGTLSVVRSLKIVALVVGAVVVVALVAVGVKVFVSDNEVARQQKQLQPFYDIANPIPAGQPGNLIKFEPIAGLAISGANAFRVLYRSQDPDGTARVTSGMVFIPTAAAPATGRPVVAWAHPTTGLGPQCAPSRSGKELADMDWLQGMLDKGWIVTATDYSGLGTPGTSLYLVGQAEARDVINSVRAVGTLPNSHAGSRYAVWGHSQGGHAALFVGEVSATYAPELTLVGVAAAAPAAELASLFSQQWKLPVSWIIGSQVMVSWPTVNPALTAAQVASPAGLANYQKVAMDCIQKAGLIGAVRVKLGQKMFEQDPTTQPDWSAMIAAQTPQAIATCRSRVHRPIHQRWCRAGELHCPIAGQVVQGRQRPERPLAWAAGRGSQRTHRHPRSGSHRLRAGSHGLDSRSIQLPARTQHLRCAAPAPAVS